MLLKTLSVIVVAAALLYRFGSLYIFKQRIKGAADWPETEGIIGIIQSANMEMVERIGHLQGRTPVFHLLLRG